MASANLNLAPQQSLSLYDLGLIIWSQNRNQVVLTRSCSHQKPPPTYAQDSSISIYDNSDSIAQLIQSHLALNHITDVTVHEDCQSISFIIQSKQGTRDPWWSRMHCFGLHKDVQKLLL
jgi:hypothetical protein